MISLGFILLKGELRLRVALWIRVFFANSAAFSTAGVTLATEVEPPEFGAGGNAESPRSGRIFSIGNPKLCAAIIARTVQVPVPRSCVATETAAAPSAWNLTFAEERDR